MSTELKRTYVPFTDWKEPSKQTEYTEPTPLLNPRRNTQCKRLGKTQCFSV